MQSFCQPSILGSRAMKINVADSLGCLSDLVLWSGHTISFIRTSVRFTHHRFCWPTGYINEKLRRRVIEYYGAIFSVPVEPTLHIFHSCSISLIARRVEARIKSFRRGNRVWNFEDNLLGGKRRGKSSTAFKGELSLQPTVDRGLSSWGSTAAADGTPHSSSPWRSSATPCMVWSVLLDWSKKIQSALTVPT